MGVKVGIPQALLFHEFGGFWLDFFQNIGVPVALSGMTNKQILDRGTSLAIDESCVPLKVYLGHVDSLLATCSHIFVPRVTQYYPDNHLCAKLAGLPDIVQNTFRLAGKELISPNIENKSPTTMLKAVHAICQPLGVSALTGHRAYHQALKRWKGDIPIKSDQSAKARIAVIGHSYIIKDVFFNNDIENFFKSQSVDITTPSDIPSKRIYEEAKAFTQDIYWQLSMKIAGATRYFCQQTDISGVIMVSSFGCGPDSLVNEYLEHHILRQSDKPYMVINIDEHTGNAGLITRVEAFWDMVIRRLNT
ncbi:acyl-CoA dehydratase activase-related protein [Sporomusa sp.]|uniref:acyl-CoA dehydratase activase-related protein n=1 Tax=Sporomusa sp. TaxID=2078658 RepID=UPI002D13D7E6|nr:acyl-CoA dehydratase activase-related protein [Sporomusa sp.]HWR09741.1 acyl-CoA dehydratase activase-related protein [Sporomusa sp.]